MDLHSEIVSKIEFLTVFGVHTELDLLQVSLLTSQDIEQKERGKMPSHSTSYNVCWE